MDGIGRVCDGDGSDVFGCVDDAREVSMIVDITLVVLFMLVVLLILLDMLGAHTGF